MKKVTLIFLLVFMASIVVAQEQEAKQKEDTIKKINVSEAYITKKKRLLITETDVYSKMFVSSEPLSEEVILNGAERMDALKTTYGDDDRMYISAGDDRELKKGDIFTVYRKGRILKDPYEKNMIHGRLYQAVAKARVDVVYEDRAVVEIFDTYEVVEVGNILLPYKKEETFFEMKDSYLRAKIPADGVSGRVIHMNLSDGTFKHMAGPDDRFIASLGKEHVKVKDMVVLYKILRSDLPPLIIGDGIVLSVDESCCTVKILECSEVVEVGHYIVPFPKATAENKLKNNEKVPQMSKPAEQRKAEMSSAAGFEMMEAKIFFDINKTGVDAEYKKKFDEIKAFIDKKSEYLIILRGYSCSIGNAEYNLKLSRDRVMEIKNSLIKDYGFEEKNIETYFYGEKEAPFDNSQESERRKNRLVTVEVSAK